MKKAFFITIIALPILFFIAFGFEVLIIESELVYEAMRYSDSLNNNETVFVIAPVTLYDDFLTDPYNGDIWDFTAYHSGTVTSDVAVFTNGAVMLKNGVDDNDETEFAGELRWYGNKWCAMEAKIANKDVTYGAFFVGFSDIQTTGNDEIAVMYSGTTVDIDAVTEAAGFVYDPSGTDPDYIMGVAIKSDVAGTVVTHSVDPPAIDEAFVLRVTIDGDGDCDFWIDGVHIGRTETGITTTTALCPYIGYINHGEGANNYFLVDYVWVWQRRN